MKSATEVLSNIFFFSVSALLVMAALSIAAVILVLALAAFGILIVLSVINIFLDKVLHTPRKHKS